MENEQLLARLEGIEGRLGDIEASIITINHELGVLTGKAHPNGRITLLVKYVILPLILIVGGLVGLRLFVI